VTIFHYGGNLLDGFWQNHGERKLAIRRQTISIIGAAPFNRINHTIGSDQFAKVTTNGFAAINNGLIWFWHLHDWLLSLYILKKTDSTLLIHSAPQGSPCHDAEQPEVTQSEIRAKETAGKPDRTLDILNALDRLAAQCATQSLNPDEP
jgi:hypothetical protein